MPCVPSQLEQFNMMETAISSSSLYSPGSTLNYSQAAMMGLTGSHGSLPDTQQLGYPSHSSIPNIILTGEALCMASWARISVLVSPQGLAAAIGLSPRGEGNPLFCRLSHDMFELSPPVAWTQGGQMLPQP